MTAAGSARRVAVIGNGSIGQRHARLLGELGHEAVVVSRRAAPGGREAATFAAALAGGAIDACVIANETSLHLATLEAVHATGFSGPVLIEKPLAVTTAEAAAVAPAVREVSFVAYNLRFHPLVQQLHRRVSDGRVLSATLRVGQDLRTWRTGRDVTTSYSAHRAAGGGVLRDLSHELDTFGWLFGQWTRVAALGGRLGTLTVDSDDCWSILLEAERCPVGSIQLDYHSREPVRTISVQLEDDTLEIDLIAQRWRARDTDTITDVPRDHTYREQLRSFLAAPDSAPLCRFEEGLATVSLIEAVERSASEQQWIKR